MSENEVEVRYLVASASPMYTLANLEYALDEMGEIVETGTSRSGRTLALIECAEFRAEWVSGRMTSCLYGCNVIYRSREEAAHEMAMLAEL